MGTAVQPARCRCRGDRKRARRRVDVTCTFGGCERSAHAPVAPALPASSPNGARCHAASHHCLSALVDSLLAELASVPRRLDSPFLVAFSWPPFASMCSSDDDKPGNIRSFRISYSSAADVPDLRPWGSVIKFRAPAWDDVRLGSLAHSAMRAICAECIVRRCRVARARSRGRPPARPLLAPLLHAFDLSSRPPHHPAARGRCACSTAVSGLECSRSACTPARVAPLRAGVTASEASGPPSRPRRPRPRPRTARLSIHTAERVTYE